MGNIEGTQCSERNCRGRYHFNKYCGAFVCDKCGNHHNLGQCYCGWNIHRADPEAMHREEW